MSKVSASSFFAMFILLISTAGVSALPAGFEQVNVFTGLDSPVAVRFAPDGSAFVAEKGGKIQYFANLTATKVLTADFSADVYSNDGTDTGLLGLAVHPQYGAGKNYVYALYTRENSVYPSGRLVKLTVNPLTGIMLDSETILEGWCQMSNTHSIGDLHFGPDGALYVSGGEGASADSLDYGQVDSSSYPGQTCQDPFDEAANIREGGSLRSQDMMTDTDPTGLSGAILRIDPETGLAMPGNPNYGNADENKARIIAFGERNPYRFTFHPQTGEIWTQNTGWYSWEELNRIEDPTDAVIENFGWPCFEGDVAQPEFKTKNISICNALYADDTTTKPHIKFTYGDRRSSSGLAFYEGSTYPAEYNGALFVADVIGYFTQTDTIRVIYPDADGLPDASHIESFAGPSLGPVDLQLGPDGLIYAADISTYTIVRIEYHAANPESFGTLAITSTPQGASISIDGAPQINRTPTSFVLPQGNYSITLSMTGRKDATVSTTITANKTTDVPVLLAVVDTGMRFNAGGPTYIDTQARTWAPDTAYVIEPSDFFTNPAPISDSVEDALYQSERSAIPGSTQLGYEFPVPNGNYIVTLHFAEIDSAFHLEGLRVFDAYAEGEVVKNDLDIYAISGADTSSSYFTTVPVSDGNLSINFDASAGYPKVSAIEIVPVANQYTCAAIHQHDDPLTDCWLVVDSSVFDVTEASKWHPAAYHCGENISENYHSNHGLVIRPQMLKFQIGITADVCLAYQPEVNNTDPNPVTELFVPEGSWNPLELISIVESTSHSLLFVDGTTHSPVARIHDIGDRPHTSVFSPEGDLMYIISRDGWLSKIDLTTLKVADSAHVGEDARGTAITSDGAIVAVGNYDPRTVVLLSTQTLSTLATFELVVEQNGTNVTSRAGALLEDGDNIIVALKDVNSVWVIDAKTLTVTHKYYNIGSSQTPLHDGFVTPNGQYFIVAAQGSNTAWVLDLDTMTPVGEVPTGRTPHTGRGAVWGDYAFVPALGEGNITAIDMRTWEPAAYIATGGPGLFVRSYDANPLYPYVWADTSFGEHRDEIYVIDGASLKIVKTLVQIQGNTSMQPEFTRDGRYVYIAVTDGDAVYVYDSLTFEIVATLEATTPTAISAIGTRLPVHSPVTDNNIIARINVGGNAYNDSHGQQWSADTYPLDTHTVSSSANIKGTVDHAIYQNARRTDADALTYAFAIPDGKYQVRLHFAELGAFEAGINVFDIIIENEVVENNFDIFAAAGMAAAVVKEYSTTVSDGVLTVALNHKEGEPLLAGIEIIAQDAACYEPQPGTYVANGDDIVAATNWNLTQTVTVELGEFSFSPSILALEVGQPYKIILNNTGLIKHEFEAEEFFRTVALHKAQDTHAEVKTAYFSEIEVFAGEQVELYVVPLITGTYAMDCAITGHHEAGMFGSIIVTGSATISPAPVIAQVSDGDWVQNAANVIAGANWTNMQTVRIELDEFSFSPNSLAFEVGKPYKVEIVNIGVTQHEFEAESFFRTTAFRKAQDEAGEFKSPFVREVEVFPSQQLDLYFIPTKAGTFGLDCAIAGHHEAGMFGTITVSGSDLEQLTCARPTGAMRVMSSPAGAAVFVDGINIGAAPATYNAIPGEHTVQCELSGYTSSTVAVTITIGSTTEVDCDLQRIIKRSSGGGGGGGSSKRITAINVTNNTAAVPPVNTETAPPAPPVDKLPTSDATSGEGAAVTASDAQAQNELQGSTARAPNSEQESPSALTGAVTGEPSESTQGIKWRYVYYALGAAVILGAAALVFRARRLKRRQA